MNLKEFVNPPKRYRPCPFWSWNANIEPSEIENRVREMKRKGFGGFVVQARQGLKSVFMEDDWMRAVRRAVETSRETELECWLHDDDRSPSGTVCGSITESNNDNKAMALILIEDAAAYKKQSGDIVLAYVKKTAEGNFEKLETAPEQLDATSCFIARRAEGGNQRYHGAAYADLLNPDTVQAFLDASHERYSKLFRYDFGEFLPGIFTSGPTIERNEDMFGNLPDSKVLSAWTPGFPDFFKSHYGFKPEDKLSLLLSETDEGRLFTHQVKQALEELFIKSFTKAVSEWCSEHEFKLAGYVAGDTVGQMSHLDYFTAPAANTGQGNANDILTLRMAASVANQLGKERVVSELFSGLGNAVSYLDLKQGADLALVNGATVLSPSFAQYSLLGERKRDCPPTLSYHQYHWEHIRTLNDYLGRCSWAASMGSSAARVLVMAPDTIDSSDDNSGRTLLSGILDELSKHHIAYDIGSERILKRHGSTDGDSVKIGKSAYSLLILPTTENLRLSTIELLEKFNGPIIAMGDIQDDKVESFLLRGTVSRTGSDMLKAVMTVTDKLGVDIQITGDDDETASGILVNHRVEAGAHLVFVVNTNAEVSQEITLDIAAIGGVVELEALSGRAFNYASDAKDGRTRIKTTMQPSGSKIFLIDQTQTSSVHVPVSAEEDPLSIAGPYSFQRNHENTLTIDRCKLEIDGKTLLEDASLSEAKAVVWKKTGIDEFIDCQPWYIEQRNIRTRTNRTVLTYTFNVRQATNDISLALESADRFTVSVNGTKVETTPGKWYLDKRMPVLDLEGHVIDGVNTITAETDYLWDTEIENIYLIGDFAVGSEADGFPIITEEETLASGSWTDQGYPFYPGSMTYSMEFDLEFTEDEFFEIDLSGIEACNTFVTVNGTDIGSIPFPPYRADISAALQQGNNKIEIEVFATIGNLLGEQKPGMEVNDDKKALTPYGLINPPKLVKITETEG